MKIYFEKDYVIETTGDYSPIRKNTFTKKKRERLDGRELYAAISKKTESLGLSGRQRAMLDESEMYVTNTYEYKKLFAAGTSFEVKENQVNVMVGDNGCGKSTLIKLLFKRNNDYLASKRCLFVDMEKSNPTVSKPKPNRGDTYSMQEVSNMFMWAVESHGETREGVLLSVFGLDFDVLVLDEPEQGLSLRNQLLYFKKMREYGKTILLVTHSKVFIENADEVFDVESMSWKKSGDYLREIFQ